MPTPTLLKLQEEQSKQFAKKFGEEIAAYDFNNAGIYIPVTEEISQFILSATQEAYEAGWRDGLDRAITELRKNTK